MAAGTGSSVELARGHVLIIPEFKNGSLQALQNQLQNSLNGGQIGHSIGQELGGGIQDGLDGSVDGTQIGQEITEPIEDQGEQAGDGFGTKFMGAIAALGIGAALVGGIQSALEQTDLAANFGAKLGMDPADAQKHAEGIKNVYTSAWGESMEEVEGAYAGLLGSFKGADTMSSDELESMTTDVLKLSQVFGYESSEIQNAMSSMMDNGTIGSWEEGIDVLTSGLQNAGTRGEDLLDTMTEYSGNFKTLGMDSETAVAALQNFTDAGLMNTDYGADALREFSIRATDGTADEFYEQMNLDPKKIKEQFVAGGDEAKKAFNSVMGELNNMEGLDQKTAIQGVFGSVSEDFYNVFANGVPLLDLDINTEGAGDKLEEAIDTPAARMESFKRQFSQGFIDIIGGQVIPLLDDMTTILTEDILPVIQPIGEKIKGVFDWVVKWRDVLTPIAVGLVGLATPILVVAGAMKVWAAGTALVTAAQAALNFVMKMNPIMRIVSIVFALGAALIYLWKTNEGFREAVTGLWDGIKFAFSESIDWIVEAFRNAGEGIGQFFGWIGGALTGLGEGTLNVFAAIGSGIGGFFTGIWDGLMTMNTNIQMFMIGVYAGIGQFIANTWEKITSLGSGIADFFTNIGSGISGLFNRVIDWYSGKVQAMFTWIADIGGKVKGVFTDVADTINGAFTFVFDGLKGTMNLIIDGINVAIQGINALSITTPEWIPVIGGKTWNPEFAQIPNFASGGTIRPTSGGTIIRVAEAGRAETVVDADLYRERMKELRELQRIPDNNSRRGGYEAPVNINLTGFKGDERTLARHLERERKWAR